LIKIGLDTYWGRERLEWLVKSKGDEQKTPYVVKNGCKNKNRNGDERKDLFGQ